MAKLIKKNNKDFTIVANRIFYDKELSYKEIGLLSQLISLPDNWDFNIKGLSSLHKDSRDSVASGLIALENKGYLTRVRSRNDKGTLGDTDYYVYDNPDENTYFQKYETYPIVINIKGDIENKPINKGIQPETENPILDNPTLDKPHNKESNYKECTNSVVVKTELSKKIESLICSSNDFLRYQEAGSIDLAKSALQRLMDNVLNQSDIQLAKISKFSDSQIINLFNKSLMATDNVFGSFINPDGFVVSEIRKEIEKC